MWPRKNMFALIYTDPIFQIHYVMLVLKYIVVAPQGGMSGGICLKYFFALHLIMTNVLKFDQIWFFQHKNGKNIKFLHTLHALFHFPTKTSCPLPHPPPQMMLVPQLWTQPVCWPSECHSIITLMGWKLFLLFKYNIQLRGTAPLGLIFEDYVHFLEE